MIRFSVIPSRPCLGAVYLDQGLEAATDRIYDWFKSLFESALEVQPLKDSKTTLQEWLQQRGQVVA